MRRSAWAALALTALLAGCEKREALRSVEPLVIPDAAKIESIDVERMTPAENRFNDFQIHDRSRMEAIVAELRRNNISYSSQMDGRAPQEFAIALNGSETMLTMIWVGPDWLGGVDEEHENPNGGGLQYHYRRLPRDQYLRLVALVRQPTQ